MMTACTATGARAKGERLKIMQASENWIDGKFRNALKRVDGSYWGMFTKFLGGGEGRVPKGYPPIKELSAKDFEVPPQSGLRITWLGHSTLLVEIDGKRILVDPVWSERASPFDWVGPKRFHAPPLAIEDLPAIDAVVISHDHYDHLDHRTIIALGARIPLYAVPLGVGAHLESWGVAPERIVERDWWGEVAVDDITLIATPARHFSGRSIVMADQNATLWAGWILKGPQHKIYYSGDTAMSPKFAEIGKRYGPFDAALIETGAYNVLWADVHMGPEQAVQAFGDVGGGLFIPVHWGTYHLALHAWTEPVERVLVAAQKAGASIAIPFPGQSIEPSSPPALVRWWPDVNWQNANQAPVVSSGLVKSEQAQERK